VLPSTVDASTGLGGYQGALGFVRPRVPGRGIGVVSVRGVCVGRAPDLWCTSNGPSVTTWGSSLWHDRAPQTFGEPCAGQARCTVRTLMPGGDGVYFKQGYDRRFDSEPVSRELLANMAARLLHRGPDATGIWTQGDVGFAHTRLSIIDVLGSQRPMAGAGGHTHLVFNGEILNYRELRAGLWYPFRTRGDTEVLLDSTRSMDRMGSSGCAVSSPTPYTIRRPVRRTSSATGSAFAALLLLRGQRRVRVRLGNQGTASGHRRAMCRRGQPARLPGPPVTARSVHSHRGGYARFRKATTRWSNNKKVGAILLRATLIAAAIATAACGLATPAHAGTVQTFADLSGAFVPQWISPVVNTVPELQAVSTPYGPGFAFVSQDSDVAIWNDTLKAVIAQARNKVTTSAGLLQR